MVNHLTRSLGFESIQQPRCLDGADIARAVLKATDCSDLLEAHAKYVLLCYVDPVALAGEAAVAGETPGSYLRENFLPDAPHVVSGNFGEILMQAGLEACEGATFPLKKLRLRWRKNDVPRGTDLIGFVVTDPKKLAPSDTLFVCEVKTRARSVSDDVLYEAYRGVAEDVYSRLADSLRFQGMLLRQAGETESADTLGRFGNPLRYGTSKLVVVAGCVHELRTWADKFLDALPESNQLDADESKVRIIVVEGLWDWIMSCHESACKAADVSLASPR